MRDATRKQGQRRIRKCLAGYASLALFILAAGASPTLAQRTNPCVTPARDYWTPDGRSGDLQFDIPQDWQRIDDQGMLELVPSGERGRDLTRIGFLPPQTLNGNVRQYFESVWAQWLKRFNALDNGEPEMNHSAKGFDVLTRYSRIYAPSIGNGTFRLGVAVMGNRAEAYFFIDNTGNIDHEQAFSNFEHSVQFAGREKSALPEPGVPCGLNGIYVGWKRTAGYRNGIVSEAVMKIETMVFFPDGNVIRQLPERGLKGFDFGREIKESRESCGRYRMIGDQVRITWSDDTTATGNRDGTNLRIGGWSYAPAANSDGLRLHATYRTEWAPTGPRIRFSSDGRFEENGILDSIDYSGPDKSRGGGRYSIERNTVELHYANGRVVPLSFFIFADDQAGEHPKLIHLNSKAFVLTQ